MNDEMVCQYRNFDLENKEMKYSKILFNYN